MATWIWERPDWPKFRYDGAALAAPLADAAHAIGRLRGRVSALNAAAQDQAGFAALEADVLKSSAIEGDVLDPEAVRSSLARRLGIEAGGLAKIDRHVDGMVAMTLDATQRAAAPVTASRLKAWQAALFPTGRSGLTEIRVGDWRDDAHGPMQVVSGPMHRPKVHFEAPPAARLQQAMDDFLGWLERSTSDHPLIKAGLAHLWFVTVHPFDDGNGRVSRAISDLVLSRYDGEPYRFYSMSAQIQTERKDYYTLLERTQRADTMDVTPWVNWFIACLDRAVRQSERELERVLAKALFWQRVAGVPFTDRQTKALNKVLDEFRQPITNRTWAALTKASPDTALRDLKSLVEAGVLERLEGGGRSVSYWLVGVAKPVP